MLLLACGIDNVTELARIIKRHRVYTSDVLYDRRKSKSEPTRLLILKTFHAHGLPNVEYEDLWPNNGHKRAA
ncbi:MAG: hypothetical protein M0Z79_11085 [Nitrospiraceae bacterium]|nr:hypothetical protein [Nitrospiraceae bacterium]